MSDQRATSGDRWWDVELLGFLLTCYDAWGAAAPASCPCDCASVTRSGELP